MNLRISYVKVGIGGGAYGDLVTDSIEIVSEALSDKNILKCCSLIFNSYKTPRYFSGTPLITYRSIYPHISDRTISMFNYTETKT